MDWLLTALDLHTFQASDLLVVLVLVILEGLLSCDNAVVLALLVKHLPPDQRGRALRYGIIGAYVFRIIALLLATWIMSKWYLKVLGGLYLVWMFAHHFWHAYRHRDREEHAGEASAESAQGGAMVIGRRLGLSAFWSTVIAVELTDIVFSVDSIAAAVALSSKLWVLILGALLGILAMRFAAQGFVVLLEKFPRLEGAAFVAVGVIGFKLLFELPADVLGRSHQFPEGVTYATASEYHHQVDQHARPVLAVRHVLTINSAAAPEPVEAIIRTGQQALVAVEFPAATGPEREQLIAIRTAHEYRRAQSDWNLHLRPLIEIEGWLSSLAVVVIFAFGFKRRNPATGTSDGRTDG